MKMPKGKLSIPAQAPGGIYPAVALVAALGFTAMTGADWWGSKVNIAWADSGVAAEVAAAIPPPAPPPPPPPPAPPPVPDTAVCGQGLPGNLNPQQCEIAAQIIAIGEARQLPPRAWQIALQAGMTESSLRPLDYGDRDSLGIFQMRPSMGWGTSAQVVDPTYAINKFYDVLIGVPGWNDPAVMRTGDAAQKVERSAYPDRYHRWEAMAVGLIEYFR